MSDKSDSYEVKDIDIRGYWGICFHLGFYMDKSLTVFGVEGQPWNEYDALSMKVNIEGHHIEC
jgi:uncharacterized Fe-S cluster protein YjdI